jgi:hypothetical protein
VGVATIRDKLDRINHNQIGWLGRDFGVEFINEIKFRKGPRNRLGLVLGTGMQIVTSSYHSYNHGLVLTGRIVF